MVAGAHLRGDLHPHVHLSLFSCRLVVLFRSGVTERTGGVSKRFVYTRKQTCKCKEVEVEERKDMLARLHARKLQED